MAKIKSASLLTAGLAPLAVVLLHSGVIFADTPVKPDPEPTIKQIYSAVEAGHLDQAQEMITRVLKAHPQSAKAHYVAAEVDARQQNYGFARKELALAEKLAPGLPFASARSVQKLKQQLARDPAGHR